MATLTATSNKTIVKGFFDAFKKGDIPHILNGLDENAEFNAMGAPQIPYGGQYQGKGAARFFQLLNETLETTYFEPSEIFENERGDVSAYGVQKGKGRKTGKTFEVKWAMLFKFKNGKAVYYQNYFDTAQVVAVL